MRVRVEVGDVAASIAYGQVSDTIFTDVTRNAGIALDVFGEDGCVDVGLDVVAVSTVPVTCTLWFRCSLRFTSAAGVNV